MTSNPSTGVRRRGSRRCSTATGQASAATCKAVVRAILLDQEARGDVKTDAELRAPASSGAVHRRTSCGRSTHESADGSGAERRLPEPAERVSMGMDVFRPPSVFSYFSPWHGRARHRRRARSGVRHLLDLHGAATRQLREHDRVLDASPSSANAPAGTSLDLSPLQALAGNPAQLVDALNDAAAARLDVGGDASRASSGGVGGAGVEHAEARPHGRVSGRHVVAVSGGEITMERHTPRVPAADAARRASDTRSAPPRSSPASSGSA